MTRYGMKESEMEEIAELFKKVIIDKKDVNEVKKEVIDMRKNFLEVKYTFDDMKDLEKYSSKSLKLII